MIYSYLARLTDGEMKRFSFGNQIFFSCYQYQLDIFYYKIYEERDSLASEYEQKKGKKDEDKENSLQKNDQIFINS